MYRVVNPNTNSRYQKPLKSKPNSSDNTETTYEISNGGDNCQGASDDNLITSTNITSTVCESFQILPKLESPNVENNEDEVQIEKVVEQQHRRKKTKKINDIWQHCNAINQVYAKCNLCKAVLSYRTSNNIKKHLVRKHNFKYPVGQISKLPPRRPFCFTKMRRKILSKLESPNVENNEHEVQMEEVGVQQHRREKAKKITDIWEYCNAINQVYAQCNLCKAVLSYRTSNNIKKHLARKHNFKYSVVQISKHSPKKTVLLYEDDEEKASASHGEVDNVMSNVESPIEEDITSFHHTYSRKTDIANLSFKNRLDQRLLDLFIRDYQSFRIVKEVGFRSLVKALNASYVIPSKLQIVTSLGNTYEKCLLEMKEHAQYIKECCLTTESWCSDIKENFISVTVHFIDEEFTMKSILLECVSLHATTNIARELQRITEEWGINKKILLAVSDNNVDVINAMAELKWNDFGCFANTINSVVQKSLLVMDTLLKKVKSVIFHFKRNVDASSKLEVYQKDTDATIKPKKLIRDDGRWISTLQMLERFLELEDGINQISGLYQDVNVPQLTSVEWKTIRELCQVFKPFASVANFISTERYTSASLVIVLTKELDNALEEMLQNEFTPGMRELLMKLKSDFNQQMAMVEVSETLALCTYLDPRFKHVGFSNPEAADATKEHLIELLSSRLSQQTSANTTASRVKVEYTNEASFSIWQSFEKRVSESKQSTTGKPKTIIEVERYLEDELIDHQKNPLEWWREYKSMFPSMSIIARKVLCALGTSVPGDRIFSKSGYALNIRRNSLSGEEMKILTFLNGNFELFRKSY